MAKRKTVPDEMTLSREDLREMLAEAAAEGARQALAEVAEAEAQLVESADAKAARMDRAWAEQVKEMGTVEIVPDRDRSVSVNGYTIKLTGGVAQQVPVVYADVYRQSLEQGALAEKLERKMAAKAEALARLGG